MASYPVKIGHPPILLKWIKLFLIGGIYQKKFLPKVGKNGIFRNMGTSTVRLPLYVVSCYLVVGCRCEEKVEMSQVKKYTVIMYNLTKLREMELVSSFSLKMR